MHDGAGAWLKSAAARACLAGVGIGCVEDFFHYCRLFLNTNKARSNFTSGVPSSLIAHSSITPPSLSHSSIIKPSFHRETFLHGHRGACGNVSGFNAFKGEGFPSDPFHQARPRRLVFLGNH